MKQMLQWLDGSVIWILLAFIGFLCLPSTALFYGFSESTAQEIYEAMGWNHFNLSWIWFLSLLFILIAIPINRKKSPKEQGIIEFTLVLSVFLFLFISATLTQFNLGYAVFILILSLIALATNALAKMQIMQGDKFIIASLISIILLIFFFIVYPTLAIFIPMFYIGHQFIEIINESYILRIITNSLRVSLSVGILTTFLGLCFALYTTRIAKHTAIISKIFSVLPIVTPPFVVGLGVTLMLGRSGYITQFGVDNLGGNNNWLYGFNGILIAHTLALTPISFMILEGALKSIPPTIEEAAYTLRSNRYQTFFYITFPLLKPALANSFLVVVIQSLADFSTPLVLGGNYDVIASQIYFYIAGTQLDYTSASILGSLLLFFSLAIFIVQYLWVGKRSYVTVLGKSYRGKVQELPQTMKYFIMLLLGGWVLFNTILYGSIFYGSFTTNWGVDYSLTLKNYQTLFGQGFSDGAWPSLIHTILFAAIAAPITSVFGLLIAYIIVRREFRGKKVLEFLTLLCFAVPGTVAGVSYILAFNNAPIYLTGTGIIIILSMVMRNIPVGMRAAIAGLGQLDKSLDEAALSLKGSSFQTLIYVVFPLLKPVLFSALVTSFVRAMTTVSAIVFLVTADTRIATSYILNRVEDGEYGIAVAYGSILIIVMMGVILLFNGVIGDTRVMGSKVKK